MGREEGEGVGGGGGSLVVHETQRRTGDFQISAYNESYIIKCLHNVNGC